MNKEKLFPALNEPMRERHMVSHIELENCSHSLSYEITACAPNRRRVAATCFASSTHGATCPRDMSLRLVA